MENTIKNKSEEWRDIEGFEGFYQVSNRGNVRALNYNRQRGLVRNLKPALNKFTGYMSVILRKPSGVQGQYVVRQALVHRLVAKAFIENPNHYTDVDHINSKRTLNSVGNLRWVSRKQNNSKRHARMLKSANHKTTSHKNSLVKATNITTGETRLFKNMNLCAQGIGCSHVLVVNVMNPKHFAKTAKGWTLEFVPLTYGILTDI